MAEEQTPDRQDIELIAELVGTTNAHMKKLDDEIVSSSANLQQSNNNWDPHKIVKSVIAESGATVPSTPPPGVPPAGVHPSVQQQLPPPPPSPVPAMPVHTPVNQPVVQVVTREFENRLEVVESKLDKILSYMENSEKLDEKISGFVDRGLKNKVKQITLKLDDSKD